MEPVIGIHEPIRKGDWIRFQVKSDRRVLEGFVQAMNDEAVLVGKAPDSYENEWHAWNNIELLHHQLTGAPL